MLRLTLLFTSFALALAISGCTTTQRSVSANQNSRVSLIVIHHTTSNFEDSYYVLTEPTSRPVSSRHSRVSSSSDAEQAVPPPTL